MPVSILLATVAFVVLTRGDTVFYRARVQSVYIRDRVRIARDVRGDTLVVAPDGLPRVFE